MKPRIYRHDTSWRVRFMTFWGHPETLQTTTHHGAVMLLDSLYRSGAVKR